MKGRISLKNPLRQNSWWNFKEDLFEKDRAFQNEDTSQEGTPS